MFINKSGGSFGANAANPRIMTFTATRETQGGECRFITEIVGMKVLAELPGMPSHIRGAIELDGKIIPVVDVRKDVERELTALYSTTCIVVFEISGTRVGLLADSIADAISAGEAESAMPQH